MVTNPANGPAKVIVITGVSRGLGLALTHRFIEAGHTVCGCARSAGAIARLQQQWGAPHSFQRVDVADPEQVRLWAQQTLVYHGPPDFLINNAALINTPTPLWQVSLTEFSQLIDVNVKGMVHVIHHFVPAMVARGQGIIVNLSSGWGRSTSPKVAPYCGSKWAVEGLTRALAQELPTGLAAIPLSPGVIDTDMLQTCFGEAATGYPSPTTWSHTAAPFILNLTPSQNGQPLTVPQ